MKKVLILCTGNSCRSQMAEAFMREISDGRIEAFSAGLEPTEVNPHAIRVMKEAGIDISDHKSKDVKDILGRERFDSVIFVCHHAEQNCPRIFPFTMQKLSWPFEDPAAFKGTEEETLAKFREIRDQIKAKIEIWLEQQEFERDQVG